MGEFANGLWLKVTAWAVTGVIVALNAYLLWDKLVEWIKGT